MADLKTSSYVPQKVESSKYKVLLDREDPDNKIFNNQTKKSWSHEYMMVWFDWRNKEKSNTRWWKRLWVLNPIWFNNVPTTDKSVRDVTPWINPTATKVEEDNKFTFRKDTIVGQENNTKSFKEWDRITESQCFEYFKKFVLPYESNYKEEAFNKFNDMKWNWSQKSFPKVSNDTATLFKWTTLKDWTPISSKEIFVKKVKEQAALSTFEHEKVWWLQNAINVIQCDSIMADWKLWNYTIKAFCECLKPEYSCVDVEETELWKFNIKNDKKPEVKLLGRTISDKFSIDWEKCKKWENSLKDSFLYDYTSSYSFWCHWPNANWYVPMCCPTWLQSEQVKKQDWEKVWSCCIQPENCVAFTDSDGNSVTKFKTCWPNNWADAKFCKNKEWKEWLICPCFNWENSKTTDEWKTRKCPCEPEPTNCEKFCKDEKWIDENCITKKELEIWWTCWLKSDYPFCKDWKGGVTEICPCPVKDWTQPRQKKDEEKYQCKCITDITEIEKMIEKMESKPDPKTTFWPDWNITEIKNIPICYPCKDNKPATYYKWKLVCDECKKWERFDYDKDKCVCDPAQQCCGIKLNTNVPWIWRCIEFGATNNTNKTVTNEYGDGNTTITVNVLNAFPVLMSALWKIFLTVFFLFDFWVLIYAWTKIASWDYEGGKKRIYRVAIWLALVGASWVILHAINPNFFL